MILVMWRHERRLCEECEANQSCNLSTKEHCDTAEMPPPISRGIQLYNACIFFRLLLAYKEALKSLIARLKIAAWR